MTKIPPIIERAKQGDSHAIAALINRHLQVQGVTAKTKLKGDCLRLMLEGNSVPNQAAMVQFIYQGMTKLAAKSIKTVKIYGKQTHLDFPAWSQELDLDEQPQPILNHSLPEESRSIGGIFPEQLAQELERNQEQNPQNQVDGERENQTLTLSDTPFVTAEIDQPRGIATSLSQASPDSNTPGKNVPVPKQISRLLIAFLGLYIGFNSLFVVYAAVWATSYSVYDLLDVADTTGILIYLIHRMVIFIDSFLEFLELISDWIYTVIFLLSLVWLHRVHAYLRTHEPDYPIKPWGAVARFAIPFYSLWGIWNTLNTLAQRLKVQEAKLAHLGKALRRWIPGLYINLFGANVLDQMYWYGVSNANGYYFSPWLFFAYASTTLFFSLVWLKIVRIINQVMTQIGKNK